MNSLRESLQEYIDLRRGLGYKMHEEGLQLPQFVSFMEEHKAEHISARLALEWAQRTAVKPADWARRLCFVRGFARHRIATDNLTEIPPPGLLPYRSTHAKAHMYTDDEIRQLLDAALELPVAWPSTALRPWVLYGLIGLLSVTGMRLSDRVWVNVPSTGYVGVGRVTGRAVQAADFKIIGPNGEAPALDVLTQGDYHREFAADPERSEWFVPVEWLKVVPLDQAVKEIGFFGNQNTVCKPTTPKWRSTVDRLKDRFGIVSA